MNTNKLLPLLSELAVFVTVVEEGSFSRTATRLGVRSSSVSRSVSRLESALNKQLLERTTRKMRLTTVGEEVFHLAQDMLNSARHAVAAAYSSEEEVSGELRVCAPKALSRQVLAPILLDFVDQYPRVTLHLKVSDHFIDPISDEIDIAIVITESPMEGLVAKPLGESRLVVCASQEYLDNYGQPQRPEQLADHNCIRLGETPADNRWHFVNGDQECTVSIKGNIVVNHSEIRRDAVLRHKGIGLFPEFSVRDHIQSGQIIELLPDWKIRGKYQGQIIAQYAQSRYIPNQLKTLIQYLVVRIPEFQKNS